MRQDIITSADRGGTTRKNQASQPRPSDAARRRRARARLVSTFLVLAGTSGGALAFSPSRRTTQPTVSSRRPLRYKKYVNTVTSTALSVASSTPPPPSSASDELIVASKEFVDDLTAKVRLSDEEVTVASTATATTTVKVDPYVQELRRQQRALLEAHAELNANGRSAAAANGRKAVNGRTVNGEEAEPSAPSANDAPIVPNGAALVLETDSINGDEVPATKAHSSFPPPSLPSDLNNPLPTKLLNSLLLTLSFGFALYTVLNVDHGMTRGWTPSEITMRIPFDNWSSYENSLSSKPVVTKTIINVVIYLLGDWLSQTIFQKKDVLDFDAGRTVRNGLIGLCFGPLVHEYYEFSDIILPVDVGINRVYKIFMDQTVYLYVKCCLYIIAVGVLSGQTFGDAKDNAKDRIGGIMVTAWKFWPLVHCVTYGVIPARHRILWVNSVDLIWNAILALKTSSTEEEEGVDEAAIAVDADADAGVEVEGMPLPELVMEAADGGTAGATAGLNALTAVEGLDGGIERLSEVVAAAVEEQQHQQHHHKLELHVVDEDDFEDAADGGLARQKVINGTAPLVD